ncbi:MAG: hypothetical protein E5Y65_02175 [Mesorhizobium sp.]|uniref:hypothetical protein n=1 Tax=Mesorhizobium sp. TaxID=1871066 RepID=UPI000FE9CAB1|nr:hypothetical protein [Mesorhizobium sp.]RWO63267.1 MAG: hypothetical protein EOS14_02015 [Mesorhizobium sp.]TIL76895.1 MAG: hypothetical protein E5Y70_00890 [Mesorhizobium sp.]TIL93831.1 MAG: hypothetical protein E5Y65_02175 [Mesorhizobium sp.]TIM02627.1 MAG: hypothetical protein E5Y64_04155 [Mesorhizobium sp.]
MSNDQKLSALTRSLIVGASLGTVSLTVVGCVPFQGLAESQVTRAAAGLEGEERRLCTRALQTKSVDDVNALMVRHPDSRCIAPLLGAMPASVLAALSPSAVAGLSQDVVSALPRRVLAQLPTLPRKRVVTAPQRKVTAAQY